jgi:hypothetical protein
MFYIYEIQYINALGLNSMITVVLYMICIYGDIHTKKCIVYITNNGGFKPKMVIEGTSYKGPDKFHQPFPDCPRHLYTPRIPPFKTCTRICVPNVHRFPPRKWGLLLYCHPTYCTNHAIGWIYQARVGEQFIFKARFNICYAHFAILESTVKTKLNKHFYMWYSISEGLFQ